MAQFEAIFGLFHGCNIMRFRKSSSRSAENEGGFEPFEKVSTQSTARPRPASHGDPRKVHQLCAQVREILSLALAERCTDPLLERICLISVSPAPDSSRLLVTVALEPDDEVVDAEVVMDCLKRLRPELRHEIAMEISRKKTPDLVFDLAPQLDPRSAGG